MNRENLQWLIESSGEQFDYDMAVLDELSFFKSWRSQRFRAFLKVRPRLKRVVGLTGTPSGNGLMNLFAEYLCVDGGRLYGQGRLSGTVTVIHIVTKGTIGRRATPALTKSADSGESVG